MSSRSNTEMRREMTRIIRLVALGATLLVAGQAWADMVYVTATDTGTGHAEVLALDPTTLDPVAGKSFATSPISGLAYTDGSLYAVGPPAQYYQYDLTGNLVNGAGIVGPGNSFNDVTFGGGSPYVAGTMSGAPGVITFFPFAGNVFPGFAFHTPTAPVGIDYANGSLYTVMPTAQYAQYDLQGHLVQGVGITGPGTSFNDVTFGEGNPYIAGSMSNQPGVITFANVAGALFPEFAFVTPTVPIGIVYGDRSLYATFAGGLVEQFDPTSGRVLASYSNPNLVFGDVAFATVPEPSSLVSFFVGMAVVAAAVVAKSLTAR
jgi:hypothetical protein